jgi:hypothetical protein
MIYSTLITAFANVSGNSFVGLDTLTKPTLKGGKKNPQQGRIIKQMLGANVMVFSNTNVNGYEAMIKRRLVAEGKDPESFVLSNRAWGVRIPNMPIVEHIKDGKTKYYLETIFLRKGVVFYYLDSYPIDEKNIIGLPDPEPGEQGGLDNKVIIRTFAAESIVEVRVDGKTYT